VRRELDRIEIPGEHEARLRTWAVLSEAFAERQPSERRRSLLKPALALAVVLAAVAAVASPSGRAVLDELREVVGVERAQEALFSLPSEGRLLVASDAGIWVVQQDGSKRLLGPYREASWSPFGRFVVAARQNELAALEPDGDVRWTLARPGVRSPRWAGTENNTRIAYVDRTGLRVVAGDGADDRLLVAGFRGPIAWRPGQPFVLAYATAERVRVYDATQGRVVWSARLGGRGRVRSLEWSRDGRRLLALQSFAARVYDATGRIVAQDDPSDATRDAGAAFGRVSSDVAVIRHHGEQSTLFRLRDGRRYFNGSGEFRGLAWSPDARWLLVTWPTADQWVFVRAAQRRRIVAVSNIAGQFGGSFPRIEGWCCP
jgi:hypothetical protein